MEEKERSLALGSPFADLEPFASWPFRSLASVRPSEGLWGPRGGFVPAMDVTENDDHYTVTTELPGAKKEDVTVEFHDGMLTIRGEKRWEREEKDEKRRHVERSFGTFSRSFSLPADADAEHIEARFEDGVLSVEIRKTEAAKPQTVDIKT
jgi:HSP20 family protein